MVLVKKGYLVKDGETYFVSDALKMFSELKKFAFYDKPGFARADFNAKLDSKYKPEQVKDIISRFAEIKSLKECWLVKYTK